MRGQAGFFDIDERLSDLSAKGDDLERLKGLVDFEMFRPALGQAVLAVEEVGEPGAVVRGGVGDRPGA